MSATDGGQAEAVAAAYSTVGGATTPQKKAFKRDFNHSTSAIDTGIRFWRFYIGKR